MEKNQSCASGARITPLIEYLGAGQTLYDFCLWEYKPLAPSVNKFSPATLLFNSFEVAGADDRFFDLVQSIRKGIDPLRTVWGVKLLGDEIRWEYYFYDYGRRERERSITKVLEAIRPFIRCDIEADEDLHYFMFSIDITGELVSGSRKLEEIHMYIGNPGSSVSSGICYSLTAAGSRLENFYFFFDAKREMNEILAKAACSAYIGSGVAPDELFWPELRDCRVIVVANKQQNDSLYFSGINVEQLIFFLKKLNYPGGLCSFVENNRQMLDHLQFDVGFDYRMEKGKLSILKSGYYGVF